MKNKINPMEYELLNKHFNKLKQNKKAEIRLTHKTKIEKLLKDDVKLDTSNPKKLVYNISSRVLTDDEESILSKGLQFCIETKIKNSIINVSKNELIALKSLMKDQNIVIMKADKGSACVNMNKEYYKSKVFELLSTGTSFKKIDDIHERGKEDINISSIEYLFF
jgi:hypothetical protein